LSTPRPGKLQSSALAHEFLVLVFGLDDLTSTTTRSLDLDSLLGGAWGAGQSVSDSETDTQGLRHIKSQLEGLETMYSEVLKMLGARPGGRMDQHGLRNARRRQGSLSSLPSSSVSGRPVRDRRRNDERRKVRDIKVSVERFRFTSRSLHDTFLSPLHAPLGNQQTLPALGITCRHPGKECGASLQRDALTALSHARA
jgi:hypothetical protein